MSFKFPSIAGLSRSVLALGIASVGGAVFWFLSLPLPFILGAMSFCLLATLFRLPVAIPDKIRPPMSAVIGVLLGSSFSPQMLGNLQDWIAPLLGLTVFLGVAAVICVAYYRRIAGYDLVTAYFAGMPGGLMEMIMLGEHYGGNSRRIALAHSARILIVVFTLPFLIELMTGLDIARPGSSNSASMSLENLAWLVGTAAGGSLLGRVLKLPIRTLLGPMLASVIVHATGLTSFKPPADIVMIAQIAMGATIGCRFAGVTPGELMRILILAAGSSALLLSLTVGFAFMVAPLTSYSPIDLVLAYSPGGLAEMGLIALTLQTEVAFVASHHIIRVVMVTAGAATLGKFLMPRKSTP